MKEDRKHIVDELKELGLENLAKVQPEELEFSATDLSELQASLDKELGSTEKRKKTISLKWISYAAIAATLVLGAFIGVQQLNKDLDWQEIDSVAIIEYLEEDEEVLSEIEIMDLFGDASAAFAMEEVSDEALEDYILENYINDLKQEELL